MPIPLQMLWAALLALVLRANLPTAIAITWINNPFTFIPINFFIYKVGSLFTGGHATPHHLPEWSIKNLNEFWRDFFSWLSSLGKTYLIGLPIVSISASISGYFTVQWLWKFSVVMRYKQRAKKKSS